MGKSFVPEFGFGSIPESVYLWGNTRGFDCLNLPVNEGQDGDTCDLKLCFSGVFSPLLLLDPYGRLSLTSFW